MLPLQDIAYNYIDSQEGGELACPRSRENGRSRRALQATKSPLRFVPAAMLLSLSNLALHLNGFHLGES